MPIYINPTKRAVIFCPAPGQSFNVASGTSVSYSNPGSGPGQDIIADTALHNNGGAGYSSIQAITATVINALNLGPNSSGTTLNNVSLAANQAIPVSIASIQLTSGSVAAQRN